MQTVAPDHHSVLPQTAVMTLDNGATDGQTDPHAATLVE